ncbi:MAG: DNA polymerase III subunit beta [Moorellaceae bacterium]
MQCKCLQSDLAATLKKVDAAVSRKNVIPSLSGVLLEAAPGKLRVYATDLDVGVEVFVPAEVKAEGRALPLFRVFKGIVTSLPEGELELAVDSNTNRLLLEQDKKRYSFDLMDPEFFPVFPDVTNTEMFSLRAGDLLWAVRAVSPAADNETVANMFSVFSCILIERDREKEVLRFVASDKRRMAIAEAPWVTREEGEASGKELLFPAMFSKALTGLLSSPADDGAYVEVRFNDSFIVVRTGNGDGFFARLGRGTYPDYHMILPPKDIEVFTVDVGLLKSALERAIIMLDSDASIKSDFSVIEMEARAGFLIVKAWKDPSLCYEEIAISGGNTDIELKTGANPKYLMDAVRPLNGNVIMALPPQTKLIMVKDPEKYMHLVLPVNLNAAP